MTRSIRADSGVIASSRAAARAAGGRSGPHRRRAGTSKKNGVTAVPGGPVSSSTWVAVRDEVSWNGRGRPASSSAIASPSSTASSTGSAGATATTSGSRGGDVVEAAGVDADVGAALVHLDPDPVELGVDADLRHRARVRGPSSLSSLSSPLIFANAAAMSGAVDASIGLTGWPTVSPNASTASRPSVIAARATGPTAPRSITARRTTANGTSDAAATASTSDDSSAP